jgi:hypothetical protein
MLEYSVVPNEGMYSSLLQGCNMFPSILVAMSKAGVPEHHSVRGNAQKNCAQDLLSIVVYIFMSDLVTM